MATKAKAQAKTAKKPNLQDPEIRPDYISEDDVQIPSGDSLFPALNIIHSNSPQRLKNDDKFIKGAEEGMLFNSVTGDLFNGEEGVNLIPLFVQRQYVEWMPRDQGGGLVRSYENLEHAKQMAQAGNEVRLTINYYCLHLIDPENLDTNPIVVVRFGTPSKMKPARKWSMLIQSHKTLHGSVYRLTVKSEQNRLRQSYYNYDIEWAGWAPKDLFERAKELTSDIPERLQVTYRPGAVEGEPEI